MNPAELLERIDDFLTVEGMKKNWHILAVAGIFVMAVWLRYLPALEGSIQYLQALDPYMIFRMSQHLALEGSLPQVDFMRYFPYETPLYTMFQGNIIFPALFYWLGPFLFFENFMAWAQFYPALMGGLGVLFMYLLGSELFDRRTGVFAAFFLATISGVMHRTSAGFFEKEPVGTMFMMASLWLFARAWRQEDYLAGIGSGLALGFFTISWGGSQMLWLLYPMTVGLTLLLNEDIHRLITAYTPTVIIGAGVGMALNHSTLWITDTTFLVNIGMLGLLWSRYLVEELNLVREEYLGFYVPAASVAGFFSVIVASVFSNWVALKLIGLYSKATQATGGVIAGTVAENTQASVGQLISSMGALGAGNFFAPLGYASNLVGPWPLAFIGTGVLLTSMALMLMKKWQFIEDDISGIAYISAFEAVFSGWILGFMAYFEGYPMLGLAALFAMPAIYALMYVNLEERSVFTLSSMLFIFAFGAIFVGFFGNFNSSFAVVSPAFIALAAVAVLYSTDMLESREIKLQWYYMLPLTWIVTNVLAGVAKSRLLTLTAFPVALAAGIALSLATRKMLEYDYSGVFEQVSHRQVLALVAVIFFGVVFAVNASSGYVAAKQVGGSPNSAWMENLDYMSEETPEGSVVLSWWDYGYWFESIGRRAAVADGGNYGYYSSGRYGKVNYPIADFLTSSAPENHTELLEKHSVDYIVLDNSMIGKYSAVSQISNRDNDKFESMLTLSTSRNIQESVSRNGNDTVVSFQGRGLTIYTPLNVSRTGVEISSAPTLETQQGRIKIDCVLTPEGTKEFNTSRSSPYCVAEDPVSTFESAIASSQTGNSRSARLVLVPKNIADSTLVKLYLQDGHGIDFVEKVPGGSNRYVKMWKVVE